MGETEALVRTLLAMEACRINLHHPGFSGNPSRVTLVMEEVRAELAAFQSNSARPLDPRNGTDPFVVASEPQRSQGVASHQPSQQRGLMEGGVSRRTEERGLILGTATVLWQERHLVLGRDRVLRVYKHKADLLLDKHEVCSLWAYDTLLRLSTHVESTLLTTSLLAPSLLTRWWASISCPSPSCSTGRGRS